MSFEGLVEGKNMPNEHDVTFYPWCYFTDNKTQLIQGDMKYNFEEPPVPHVYGKHLVVE
jgi:hypothetical protein